MRKTKIVCTMGPSTDDEGVLQALIREGMDVARFNFSHGTHADHKQRMDALKEARVACGRPVAILLDTKGPEIRVKTFQNGKQELVAGQEFVLTTREVEGTEKEVSVTYQDLCKDVRKGTTILIDDGLIEMQVKSVEPEDVICEVINGGVVSNNKGINIPGVHLSMPYMNNKDQEDVLFGIEQQVDFVAASFVRTADDVRRMRAVLDVNGGEGIKIISKIENMQGVENIDEIISVSDGIMVARGDMGVEIPCEEVPVIQKKIIKKVYEAGKVVITATQMLESMIQHPRPTRAETTDVANAIYDGTSAIMLSGETAAGKYPVEAVRMMARIANRAEEDIDYRKRFFHTERQANPDITDAICHATCTTAHDLNAKAIITVTKSGHSARMISRYRPKCDIIGCTTDERASRQLSMSWGVKPVLIAEESDVFDLFDSAIEASKEIGILEEGDITVITSGVPIGRSGTTNMIKVQEI